MVVPGTQRHCLTALHRMYVQDPKGREDVVLRIHLVGWYHHQAVRSKVAAGSHVEIEEVDLLQVSLCLHYGHYLATQEGSLR